MMCCIGPAWAVLGYFLGRWCLFAWKPLDYPAVPRWMCNSANDLQRRWMLGLLITLLVMWWVPLIWLMVVIAKGEPRLLITCVSVGLVGCGLVKWLELSHEPNPSPPPRLFPVGGRWIWGLLVAIGMLGLVWQYVFPYR